MRTSPSGGVNVRYKLGVHAVRCIVLSDDIIKVVPSGRVALSHFSIQRRGERNKFRPPVEVEIMVTLVSLPCSTTMTQRRCV